MMSMAVVVFPWTLCALKINFHLCGAGFSFVAFFVFLLSKSPVIKIHLN